jgi:hypothetical protein
LDSRLIGHERRGSIRRMNDVTNPAASEDAVKLVFTLVGITSIPALAQTVKLPTVVPATWLLTDVSTDRALTAKLRTGHLGGSLCESWITLQDNLVIGHFR